MELFDWEKNSGDIPANLKSTFNTMYSLSRSYIDKKNADYMLACVIWVDLKTDRVIGGFIFKPNKPNKKLVFNGNGDIKVETLKIDLKLNSMGYKINRLGV